MGCPRFLILAFSWMLLLRAPAQADIVMWYVKTTCDPIRGHALIQGVVVSGDFPPPQGWIPLSNISRVMSTLPPMPVCDLGQKRRVSIKAVIDDDLPRNDGVQIYLDSRPMNHPIAFPFNSKIEIDRSPKDFFVVVTTCQEDKCLSEQVTSPSFQCNKARSRVESIICGSDTLSELDTELAESYNKSLNETSDSRDFVASQRRWLKDRSKYCKVSNSANQAVPTYRAPIKTINCLILYYRRRIDYLMSS